MGTSGICGEGCGGSCGVAGGGLAAGVRAHSVRGRSEPVRPRALRIGPVGGAPCGMGEYQPVRAASGGVRVGWHPFGLGAFVLISIVPHGVARQRLARLTMSESLEKAGLLYV